MDASIQAFVSGFPHFMAQGGATLGLWTVSCVIYVLMTPHKELALVREGNGAAALSLGAVLLGLALPLAVSLAHSANLYDLAIWGAVSLLIQLIAFRVVQILLRGLPKRIADGEWGAAIVLSSVKLSLAAILAGALTG